MREITCDNCSHLQVCSLKEQFHNAQKAVDDVMVTVGERSSKRLRDFDWIKPAKLECVHFSANQMMRREDSGKSRAFYPGAEDGTRPMKDPE